MSKTDPFVRFRDTLFRHVAGAESALGNARSLFLTAGLSQSAPTASFIATIGAEETGKCLLLRERARILLNNAEVRVHTRLFADDPNWADGERLLRDVLPWGVFVGRKGTHAGGLHDHEAKLQALRDYYKDAHPQVMKATTTEIVLGYIDLFAGASAQSVRRAVEKSLYVGWDEQSKQWCEPAACVADVPVFSEAMREVTDRLSSDLPKERERMRMMLDYLHPIASRLEIPIGLIFVV